MRTSARGRTESGRVGSERHRMVIMGVMGSELGRKNNAKLTVEAV